MPTELLIENKVADFVMPEPLALAVVELRQALGGIGYGQVEDSPLRFERRRDGMKFMVRLVWSPE